MLEVLSHQQPSVVLSMLCAQSVYIRHLLWVWRQIWINKTESEEAEDMADEEKVLWLGPQICLGCSFLSSKFPGGEDVCFEVRF